MKRSLLLMLSCLPVLGSAAESLFDGKTLAGWEGDTAKVWSVRDGAIVGGSLQGNPRNEFLATRKSYRNFQLKLEYKLVGTEGFVNGGVQFRSKRIANPPNEMSGYQADIGAGYSGCLYDESRRKKMLVEARKDIVSNFEKPGDWNRCEIRAEGPRITLFLNGRRTADYTEREPGIDPAGVIALQIHGNCKAEIAFRNISIETLPDTLVPDEKQVLNRFGNADAAASAPPAAFKDGRFALYPNEVVIFTGQTNLVREQKLGNLETLLAASYARQQPRFRSMAWEADTVYEQWRDLNFGSWQGQLDAAGATTIIAQFGQIEAFDGRAKLPQFMSAYHRLIDQFALRTPRLVLISPMPFEKPAASLAPDLTLRNADVAAYANAVRDIARQRGAVFVDLFAPLAAHKPGAPRLTDNGMHLNDHGLRVVAEIIARELGASASESDDLAAIREAIIEKNRLWHDCWRPANWSFVYGDRITQMFGKPAAEDAPSLRDSFEAHKPLIAQWDERIHALARGETVSPAPRAPAAPEDPMLPALTVEQELASFTIAEGYQINLFASEGLGVAKPTQISWDEHGRMFVACSPTYPHTLPGAKPSDYVLVLEDTDHDGRADRSHRFAEGLTMVQGVEPGGGGVYVCDFDQLLHFRDTDGDGKADQRSTLFSGFGIGDTHQLINSISHGPDGSLWFTQGLHAFSRVESPWGIARLDKAGIWRLRPRTLRLSGFFNGGKAGHNCWGVAFDDFHQVFHKSGDRPDGYYTVPGMIELADPDEYHSVGPLFFTSPKTTALDIIGTSALPDEVQACAVIGGYFGNVVELHRFIDDGSGFKTEQLPKLVRSTETTFRPVDVSVGPDGAIYLADWFNPVIGHYQASYADSRRDRTHGRIWRISAKGRPANKPPDLGGMKPAELLDQLRSSERWTRYQARRLLFDAPSAEVLKAADVWTAQLDPSAPNTERLLLEVIGIFEAHESPRPELLAKLLEAKDARVRAYGARVVGGWADRLSDALRLLARCIADDHPRVRLEAIVACSRIAKPETVEVAVRALEKPADRFIDYALKQTVRSLQPLWQDALAAGRLAFGGRAEQAAYVKQIATALPAPAHPGQVIYDSLCLNCHQPNGKGLPGVYPPLEGSEWVAADKASLIKIVLHGLTGPIQVAGQEYGRALPIPMPPMGLDDQQVADVLTYIRSNFGHNHSAVTASDVKTVRAATTDRTTFWTLEELKTQSKVR